jgi:hypothetical protein
VCENVRRVIEDAAARATVNEPLAWLSMEPGADHVWSENWICKFVSMIG